MRIESAILMKRNGSEVLELRVEIRHLLKNELRPLNRFDRLNNRTPPKMTVVKDTFLHFSQLIQNTYVGTSTHMHPKTRRSS